jgi:hypothetical protein
MGGSSRLPGHNSASSPGVSKRRTARQFFRSPPLAGDNSASRASRMATAGNARGRSPVNLCQKLHVRFWTASCDREHHKLVRSPARFAEHHGSSGGRLCDSAIWHHTRVSPTRSPLLASGVLPVDQRGIMFHRSFLLLSLTFLAASAAHAADDPIMGDWKLNPQKSRLIDEMKVANLGGNKYSFDFGAGTPETIVVDGTEQAGLAGTTLAVTAVNVDEWKVVRKKDGSVELVGNWKLANGGTALDDDYTEFDRNGKTTFHLLYIYDRKGGGSGFDGDWVSASQQAESYAVELRPWQGDGLSMVVASQGVTKNVKFDGKDYADPGSRHHVVSSAQRVNARTIKLSARMGDKFVETREICVSGDGRTLTMTVLRPGRSEPDVLVFERK